MFRQIDFEEAAGKTVRAVVRNDDDEVFVSFTDGTFSALFARRMFDDAELDTHEHFSPLGHRLDLILEPLFGEWAKPMHDDARKADDEKRENRRQEAIEKRRAEFESMKIEFGDSSR